MRTILKNKRRYQRKIGRTTKQTEKPVDDGDISENEDEFTNTDDEEGTSGSGKRTKEKQGGANAKRARI